MSDPSLLEAAQAGTNRPGIEKRSEPRYSCPKLVRVRPVSVPEVPFRLSLVQNVSASGIGLALSFPLTPGTLLEVEMRNRSVVCRYARVVHCTKQEGGWLIGCALNQSLSDAELERMLS
jgi:hypothetical protein